MCLLNILSVVKLWDQNQIKTKKAQRLTAFRLCATRTALIAWWAIPDTVRSYYIGTDWELQADYHLCARQKGEQRREPGFLRRHPEQQITNIRDRWPWRDRAWGSIVIYLLWFLYFMGHKSPSFLNICMKLRNGCLCVVSRIPHQRSLKSSIVAVTVAAYCPACAIHAQWSSSETASHPPTPCHCFQLYSAASFFYRRQKIVISCIIFSWIILDYVIYFCIVKSWYCVRGGNVWWNGKSIINLWHGKRMEQGGLPFW